MPGLNCQPESAPAFDEAEEFLDGGGVGLDARPSLPLALLIAVRAETWRLNDQAEVSAFLKVFPGLTAEVGRGDYPRKISLSEPLATIPDFTDLKRIAAWKKRLCAI